MPDLIGEVKTEDKERIKDVLNDVAGVLFKYGCALIHRDHATILVAIEGPGKLRALAKVREISPMLIEFSEYDWNSKDQVKQ
jgi:hypothetical protein